MSPVLPEPELRVNETYLGNLQLNPPRGGLSWIGPCCHGHRGALWRANNAELVTCLIAVLKCPQKQFNEGRDCFGSQSFTEGETCLRSMRWLVTWPPQELEAAGYMIPIVKKQRLILVLSSTTPFLGRSRNHGIVLPSVRMGLPSSANLFWIILHQHVLPW